MEMFTLQSFLCAKFPRSDKTHRRGSPVRAQFPSEMWGGRLFDEVQCLWLLSLQDHGIDAVLDPFVEAVKKLEVRISIIMGWLFYAWL